jgi:isopentenyl-diphosphate delta-isomerase
MVETGRTRFIRLEPPPAVLLHSSTPGYGALQVQATALHEEAVIVSTQERFDRGMSFRLEFNAGEGSLELFAEAAGPAPTGHGELLRFTEVDDEHRLQLERFMTRFRKADHIRICRDEEVGSTGVSTGFERWRLPHEALPEIDKRAVDLSTEVLGRPLQAPLLISCMTGGSELAKVVNQRLARVAQRFGIALGLGSQRALLADPGLLDTYAVRDLCPDVPLLGNIGAVQMNYGLGVGDFRRAVELVSADALVLHLNPLQEAVQPEGDVDFSGLRPKVAAVAAELGVPVILKEVGNGIGPALARWVAGTEIAGVDTAGAGGTSWARVESFRAEDPLLEELGRSFSGWGIPTADSVIACRQALPDRLVIASGGMRNGIQAAKALALGADLVGIARPFLKAATESEQAVEDVARLVIEQLRVAMFCCGCTRVGDLRDLTLQQV